MSIVGKREREVDYIIPFAKMRGETSFASIAMLKRLLGTRKVGHTGTLDSFADGLLVAVSGKLTRLASFIEASVKRYEALLIFGSETDTLDVTGEVVRRACLPTYARVKDSLDSFVGRIMQVPPQFSALHVNGKRASDIMRSGGNVVLAGREVEIKAIVVKGVLFAGDDAFVDAVHLEGCEERLVEELHVEVECSKGTYIRALARDIGEKVGSVAHLKALRRLSVGCFSLKDAFRFSALPNFLSEERVSSFITEKACEAEHSVMITDKRQDMLKYALRLSPSLCEDLGLPVLNIKERFVKSFLQGKEIKDAWFCNYEEESVSRSSAGLGTNGKSYDMEEKRSDILKKGVGFVFCEGEALGAICLQSSGYKYKFVL